VTWTSVTDNWLVLAAPEGHGRVLVPLREIECVSARPDGTSVIVFRSGRQAVVVDSVEGIRAAISRA
jgi:uncharacterized protein YlzI (FlbEa/FlbD family)